MDHIQSKQEKTHAHAPMLKLVRKCIHAKGKQTGKLSNMEKVGYMKILINPISLKNCDFQDFFKTFVVLALLFSYGAGDGRINKKIISADQTVQGYITEVSRFV